MSMPVSDDTFFSLISPYIEVVYQMSGVFVFKSYALPYIPLSSTRDFYCQKRNFSYASGLVPFILRRLRSVLLLAGFCGLGSAAVAPSGIGMVLCH